MLLLLVGWAAAGLVHLLLAAALVSFPWRDDGHRNQSSAPSEVSSSSDNPTPEDEDEDEDEESENGSLS